MTDIFLYAMRVHEIKIEGMRSRDTILLYPCNQKNVINFQEFALDIEIRVHEKGNKNS